MDGFIETTKSKYFICNLEQMKFCYKPGQVRLTNKCHPTFHPEFGACQVRIEECCYRAETVCLSVEQPNTHTKKDNLTHRLQELVKATLQNLA